MLPIAYFSSYILFLYFILYFIFFILFLIFYLLISLLIPFYLFLFQWRDCDLNFGVVTHLKNHLRGKHLRHYVALVTTM